VAFSPTDYNLIFQTFSRTVNRLANLPPLPCSTVTGNLGDGTAITSISDVLCAVHTMGQARYRISQQNAWCMTGGREPGYSQYTWQGVATRPVYRS
jgi:hypothetical protein